jgi:hypothetical protein
MNADGLRHLSSALIRLICGLLCQARPQSAEGGWVGGGFVTSPA